MLKHRQEVFIRKYWDEENILFYIHFKDGEAVRQIEETSTGKILSSSDNPQAVSMLYDQSLEELDLDESDYITADEFNKAWNEK